MAKIVLGVGSSHGPQLHLPADQWWRRADADKKSRGLWFRGQQYPFADLATARQTEVEKFDLTPETARERFDACQAAIKSLSDTVARVRPDVMVILGDDQHELFHDDNMPALSVYWGEFADFSPEERGDGAPTRRAAGAPGEPALGKHIIQSLIEQDFDPAHCKTLPTETEGHNGIGHAFGYVYGRLMPEPIPNVPILVNTYYPPNQPTLSRCFQLGRALRTAIESWDSDKTVALVGSGGLSHFVIDESIDRPLLEAMLEKDEKGMTDWPFDYFHSGTSETRNWLTVAGAMQESDFQMKLVDYVPCYRSEAGTGCAMGFATWE